MAIFKDVVVNIRRLTTALPMPNHGLCLILTTASTNAYKEYSDLTAVAVDFAAGTPAYGMASAVFSQEPKTDKVAIVGIQMTTAFTEVIDGLNLVQGSNGGFTFLVSDVTDAVNMGLLGNWATANQIFYVGVVPVTDFETITNPASDYVIYMVHDKKVAAEEEEPQPTEYADAAIVGACSTYQPGSATWMFKTLVGITPVTYADQATTVETINELHYMTYVSKNGVNMTTGGFVTSGEYVDVMLGVRWIKSDMETRIQRVLVNNAKVPYDNEGIALIAGEVEATLRQAAEYRILRRNNSNEGEYTISIPNVNDIDTNKIANRVFDDLSWVAYLSGAIHHVVINGVVQY